MSRVRWMIVVAAAFVSAPATATTYTINQMVGDFHVTGFFETDGSLGVLHTTNFLDFNFSYNGSTYAKVETQITGNALTATSTGLVFDYSAPGLNTAFFLGSRGSGQPPLGFLCYQTSGCFAPLASPAVGVGFDPRAYSEMARAQVIATVAGVPEPSTWAMMVGGIGLIGGVMRRRNRPSVTHA